MWHDKLTPGILAYLVRVQRATAIVAELLASDLAEAAKRNAPWTDQTGDARDELFGTVEVAGDIVTIWLSHGVEYGKYLETRWGGRYATIMPTIERYLPTIERQLQEIFR